MTKKDFELKPGLHVSLHSFGVKSTYEGILEGDPEYINQMILAECVPQAAARILFGRKDCEGLPIHIRKPADKKDRFSWRFPKFVCFALLRGPAVPVPSDPDEEWTIGAQAAYCWFTDNVDMPLSELVSTGLEPFDWDKIAENWGY